MCKENVIVDMASEGLSEVDSKFPVGTIVWARIHGFPSWPGFIENDPDLESCYGKDDDDNTIYHVTFFGNPVSRAWVDEDDIKEYTDIRDSTPYKKKMPKKGRANIEDAVKQANYALRLCYEELFDTFGFSKRVVKPPEGTADSGRTKGDAKRKSIVNDKGEKPSPGEGRSSKNAKSANESFQIESPLAQASTSRRRSGAKGNEKEVESSVETSRQRKRSLPYEDNEKRGAKQAVGSDKKKVKNIVV